MLELLDSGIKPDYFSKTEKYGCRLNKEARGHYFSLWAEWRTEWPYWLTTITEADSVNDAECDISSIDDHMETYDDKSLKTCCRNVVQQFTQLFYKE